MSKLSEGGFAQLETFFTDHQAPLLRKRDVPSRLAYLIEHFTFDQLLKMAKSEDVHLKKVSSKCPSTANHYCSLVKKLATGSLPKIKPSYREQCEHFCKQALLNMSLFDEDELIKQKHHFLPGQIEVEKEAAYICLIRAQLAATEKQFLSAALALANQSIELSSEGDKKPKTNELHENDDHLLKEALILKIELQIQLKQFKQAKITLKELLMRKLKEKENVSQSESEESMTDSTNANRKTESLVEQLTSRLEEEKIKHQRWNFFTDEEENEEPASETDYSFPSRTEDNYEATAISDQFEWDESVRIKLGTKGRYMSITGSNDIPAGTYLIREKVLSIAYRPEHVLSRCAQCAVKIDRHSPFYPCTTCTKAVFCSRNCRKTGNETGSSVHSVECCLTSVFDEGPLAFHAYRIVSSLGIEKVVRFYRQKVEGKCGPFDVQQLREPNRARFELLDSQAQLKAFAIVDSFVGHESELEDEKEKEQQLEMLLWTLKVVLLVNCQQHYFDNLATSQTGNKFSSLYTDFVLLVTQVTSLLRKLSFNVFAWSDVVMEADDGERENDENGLEDDELFNFRPIANCLCLGVSFANHNCDAAAYWEIDDGRFLLSSACTINPGEELTLTYGPHQFNDFHKRQSRLSKYHFTCGCGSCLEDVFKLLCLKCTSCPGPVYPSPLKVLKQAKCMLCGVNSKASYEEVMSEVVQTQSRLVALCRVPFLLKKNESFPEVAFSMISKLTSVLHVQSVQLMDLYSEVWDALMILEDKEKGSLCQAVLVSLASMFLNEITEFAENCSKQEVKLEWADDSQLKRNLLLSKWLRVFSSCNFENNTYLLIEQIQSILDLGPKSDKLNDEKLDSSFETWIVKRLDTAVAFFSD